MYALYVEQKWKKMSCIVRNVVHTGIVDCASGIKSI